MLATPENLRQAVENNTDMTKLLFNHWHLSNPMIQPILKLVLQAYWNEIEQAVTNVPKIYSILASANPENRKILETPQARKYLNRQCEQLYGELYRIAWLE
jgi:hypothetical protein